MSKLDYDRDSPKTIQKMFGSIANQYDRGNAILSMQMHRLWNQALIKEVIIPKSPSTLLDLCCGTGDIAFRYLKHKKNQNKFGIWKETDEASCQVFMIDFCKEMLQCAQVKADQGNFQNYSMQFIRGDAQKIPLPNESIECTVIAYGIRNVLERDRCLQEVYRVLKPGGILGILELTTPNHPFMKFFHGIYLNHMLPFMGKLVTSDEMAYRYLSKSISNFIKPEDLVKLMQGVGFKHCWKRSLSGGIATIVCGQKPEL